MPDVIDPVQHERLLETLRDAQRLGFFGSAPIEGAVTHARQFVTAVGELRPGGRLVDIGSGGGLPGLVLAEAFPAASIELVDRRQKRTDFLERAVRRLGWQHVRVREVDVELLARSVEAGAVEPYDVVTARGFGPPAVTLRLARRLLTPAGRIVISEPPSGERWPPELLVELGLQSVRPPGVMVFSPVPTP